MHDHNSILSSAAQAAQVPYTFATPAPTPHQETALIPQVQVVHQTVPTLPEVASASVFADVAPNPTLAYNPFVAVPVPSSVPVATPVAPQIPQGHVLVEEITESAGITVPGAIAPNHGWPEVPFRAGTPWTVQLHKPQCLSCTGINPFQSATLVFEEQRCSRAESCPAGAIQFSAVGLIRVLTRALKEAKASGNAVNVATAMQEVATRQGLSDSDRTSIMRECGFL